jgi:periplasmic copper chaperone A
MKRYFLFILFMVGLLLYACTPGSRDTGLQVSDAWARPSQAGANSAVYFVVENGQAQDDMLLSAESDAAQVVELHQSLVDDAGHMMMQHQEHIAIPAGQSVEFAPGGLHIMLIGLTDDLQPGESITLQLNFQSAGTVQVEAPVRQP